MNLDHKLLKFIDDALFSYVRADLEKVQLDEDSWAKIFSDLKVLMEFLAVFSS